MLLLDKKELKSLGNIAKEGENVKGEYNCCFSKKQKIRNLLMRKTSVMSCLKCRLMMYSISNKNYWSNTWHTL